jgi:hypothetical protein
MTWGGNAFSLVDWLVSALTIDLLCWVADVVVTLPSRRRFEACGFGHGARI